MALVEQYVDSHVAVVTLNDGQHGNLLGPEMLEQLCAALERSRGVDAARAILLRSNGPDFCLGMDLSRLAAHDAGRDADEVRKTVGRYADVLEWIFTAAVPVVSFVRGNAKAGGVGLACACDIVLAEAGAAFEMGEVLFGLLPANAMTYLLSMRMTPQKTRYLVMSSRRLPAAEALEAGMVDEIVSAEDAERRARELLKRLLRSSPRALAEAKSFTAQLVGRTPAEAAALGRGKLLEMLRDPEMLAGVRAFQEGDVPSWFAQFRPAQPLTGAQKP